MYRCLLWRLFVFLEQGQDGWWGGGGRGGLGRSKQRERVSAAKFYLTQQQQNDRTNSTATPLSLTLMTSNPPKPTPTPPHAHPHPLHPAFQQSNTLNLPSFLHAPASPCRPPHSLLRNDLSISAHALCAPASHIASTFITTIILMMSV